MGGRIGRARGGCKQGEDARGPSREGDQGLDGTNGWIEGRAGMGPSGAGVGEGIEGDQREGRGGGESWDGGGRAGVRGVGVEREVDDRSQRVAVKGG